MPWEIWLAAVCVLGVGIGAALRLSSDRETREIGALIAVAGTLGAVPTMGVPGR